MSDQIGILAQGFPAAATPTLLYTVPTGTQVVVSSLLANNQSDAIDSFWVSFRRGGAIDDASQYLYGAGPGQTGGGFLAPPNAGPFLATAGLTLGANDEVWVQSLNGTSSFQLFGDAVSGT